MLPNHVLVSLDFEIQSGNAAKVSVFDRGFLFGDSVYEVLRTYGGTPFALERHFLRLKRSAESLGFGLPFDQAALEAHLRAMVERWKDGECCLRVIVTRGAHDVTLHPPERPEPFTVVIAGELPAWPPAYYERGISLVTVGVRRNLRGALNPMIKSGNYLNNVLATMEARRAGAVDAVMLNAEGYVSESSTANIFIVKEGTLVTPPVEAGILDGVLRHTVLELAEKAGIPRRLELFGVAVLHGADECFITSTTREIMPVRTVDRITYTAPGPVTDRLMKQLKHHING